MKSGPRTDPGVQPTKRLSEDICRKNTRPGPLGNFRVGKIEKVVNARGGADPSGGEGSS